MLPGCSNVTGIGLIKYRGIHVAWGNESILIIRFLSITMHFVLSFRVEFEFVNYSTEGLILII